MDIDLTGGLDPALEYFLTDQPADPEMRDSATLWIMDEAGTLALPRVTLDAIGSHWSHPRVQLNMVLTDGRTLRLWSTEPGNLGTASNGKTPVRGAGPLTFRCIEPFRRWTMEFDGTAEQSTTAAQMAGETSGKPVRLSFCVDAEMAAPPWVMGAMTEEVAGRKMSQFAGALMGGARYEQLCRVTGIFAVAGEPRRISGTGMRVRRTGVRNMAAATGHCQHSAVFPSGRAFGAIAFAPGSDGKHPFNEGFVFLGYGRPIPARIAQAPWMTRLVAGADDASLVLESRIGTIRIEGEVLLSTFDRHLFEMADTSILSQGTARYVWDGEETIGLIERCTLKERIEGL